MRLALWCHRPRGTLKHTHVRAQCLVARFKWQSFATTAGTNWTFTCAANESVTTLTFIGRDECGVEALDFYCSPGYSPGNYKHARACITPQRRVRSAIGRPSSHASAVQTRRAHAKQSSGAASGSSQPATFVVVRSITTSDKVGVHAPGTWSTSATSSSGCGTGCKVRAVSNGHNTALIGTAACCWVLPGYTPGNRYACNIKCCSFTRSRSSLCMGGHWAPVARVMLALHTGAHALSFSQRDAGGCSSRRDRCDHHCGADRHILALLPAPQGNCRVTVRRLWPTRSRVWLPQRPSGVRQPLFPC